MNQIKALMAENHFAQATLLLQQRLVENPQDDIAHFLLGNIARKHGDWKEAIYHYLSATEINPDSPAQQAYEMVMRILNFSNPDIYNP